MTENMRGNSGISMLYVLAALIVTGFIGSTLISMTASDNLNSVHFSTSESARSSAKSGLIYAVHQIQDPSQATVPDGTMDLLKRWIDEPTSSTVPEDMRWLAGSGSSYESIAGTNSKFKVEVLAFDDENYTLSLRSEAISKGAKASATGVYHLAGLGLISSSSESVKPQNALHLGGGAGSINVAMHIHGGMYIKGQGFCQSQKSGLGTDTSFINIWGNFHLDPDGGEIFTMKRTNIWGNAFFGGGVHFQKFITPIANPSPSNYQTLIIDGDVGMINYMEMNSGLSLDVRGNFYMDGTHTTGYVKTASEASHISAGYADSIFLNDTNDLFLDIHAGFNLRGKTSYTELFRGYDNVSTSEDEMDILDSLNMKQPTKLRLDIDKIKNESIVQTPYFTGNMTGHDMNLYCQSVPDNQKFKDKNDNLWTVVKYSGSSYPFVTGVDNTEFSDRIIMIVDENDLDLATKMYNHKAVGSRGQQGSNTTGGITLIYVEKDAKIWGFGGPNAFRGFIYSESDDQNTYRCQTNGELLGGIYQSELNDGIFRLEGEPLVNGHENTFDVYYDTGVVAELDALGAFYDPDATGTPVIVQTLELLPGYDAPQASLVSLTM